MSSLRFNVVEDAFKKKAATVAAPAERPDKYFGKYVFNREKMLEFLPQAVYSKLTDAIDHGTPLSRDVADQVAAGMKQWALSLGVTHYTHWFQPLTEGTAEKHDSFIEPDGKGGMIEEFSGKLLVQQEPDASSFPNGGIRNTFEARGYSAWDPSSPVFVVDDTLCIPTVFIAYTGESLDYKAPLLRALRAVDKAAVDVCHYFNPEVKKVVAYLGWEQEYFLVDEGLYAARPDLLLTGRTLMGHEASKNQQLEDHYFGAIPQRVMAFMKDLEIQALQLGVPVKTRHNEVAPNQFELAPIFEECNLAVDHNMLIMALMRNVARNHGFRVLLHEKPFKGVNGSGKHNNWSLGTDTGILLMAPGKTATDNLRFITFIVNTLMAVYHHDGLLKASIMSATNAHRLGANEAPPAIISSFLGKTLTGVLEHLETSRLEDLVSLGQKSELKLDIPQIPELLIDNTDRNRTSPFAFTGNRFEFRAVGSEANCAGAMIALNAAVAHQLTLFKQEVDGLIAAGEEKNTAILTVVRRYIKECKPICFDGNGYSEEWKQMARERGLDCETSCPLIFDNYLTEGSVAMFEATGPQRSEVGNVHQENPDRSPRAGRPGHEPHHTRGHQVPDGIDRQRVQDAIHLPRRKGRTHVGTQPGTHRADSQPHQLHQGARRCDGRSPQGGQPRAVRTQESHCLPRPHRPHAGGNPLPHRQAGADSGRPHVDAAQVPRTALRAINKSARG